MLFVSSVEEQILRKGWPVCSFDLFTLLRPETLWRRVVQRGSLSVKCNILQSMIVSRRKNCFDQRERHRNIVIRNGGAFLRGSFRRSIAIGASAILVARSLSLYEIHFDRFHEFSRFYKVTYFLISHPYIVCDVTRVSRGPDAPQRHFIEPYCRRYYEISQFPETSPLLCPGFSCSTVSRREEIGDLSRDSLVAKWLKRKEREKYLVKERHVRITL